MRISAAPACLWENICASACQSEDKRDDDKKRHQGSIRNDLAEVGIVFAAAMLPPEDGGEGGAEERGGGTGVTGYF